MKYKYNGEWIDVNIKALDSMPIGSIILFAGDTIPTGWLVCDGTALDPQDEQNSSLFAAIMYKYGNSGNNFKIPDLRGKVPVGLNSSDTDFDTLGETGGSKYLQEHKHKYDYSNGAFCGSVNTTWSAPSSGGSVIYSNDTRSTTGGVNSLTTGNSGNLQPYLVVNYIIKAYNTVPTMASVVNSYSESLEDTYSAWYVNKELEDTYSTTEVKTNKVWTDGRPIYRKVYEVGLSFNAQDWKEITFSTIGISNIDTIWVENGWAIRNASTKESILGRQYRIQYFNSKIAIYTEESATNMFLILEYTKSS